MITQRDKDIMRYIEKDGIGAASINQISKMFFKNAKYNYDQARKRLKVLNEAGLLKHYTNIYTNERVYYIEKRLTPHDVFILDFYAHLVSLGVTITDYKKEPRYKLDFMEKEVRPDAYIKYEYGNYEFITFLEVNVGHKSVLERYEDLMKSKEFLMQFGRIKPTIIVMGEDRDYYEPKNFEVKYINLDLRDIGTIFL